jgi:hypothetical protein
MSTRTSTTMVCDACGKEETNPTRPHGHRAKETEEWRRVVAGYRHTYRGFDKTEFDVCSWACAKQIHAKLAEVIYHRKTAETEAACLQWALDQVGFKQSELEAKTVEARNLAERVRTLESQLHTARGSDYDSVVAENSRLVRHTQALEEELNRVRKLDREELAFMLRAAVRPTRTLRSRPARRRDL